MCAVLRMVMVGSGDLSFRHEEQTFQGMPFLLFILSVIS